MIIDAHTHIGNSFWGQFSPEFLLDIIGDDVDIAICSNLEGIDSFTGKDEIECNLDMLNACKKFPKLKPLAVCEVDRTENADKIRKLLSEHPQFIGLKFHPEFTKLRADSDKYNDYLKVAQEYKKPCLYHSGHIRSRFSSPELIYKKAKEFPDVPIILGHLSTTTRECHERAIEIMLESIEKEDATLYADVSWVEIEDVILLIESLKNTKKGDYTHRIMWASDAPVGDFNQKKKIYAANLAKFQSAIKESFNDETLLNALLYQNAIQLYTGVFNDYTH
ncbi:TPA: hypothetical protein CPT96_11120 [Candidatus Gastranaerophilales bacterium HUM_10]|nr:MAG TPA: hypothetical protein CPT96_11120 [Candidatus Gastranaerophilales bacterium HUM_10]